MCNNKKDLGSIFITIISIAFGVVAGLFYTISIIESINPILWSAFALSLFSILLLEGIVLFRYKSGDKCLYNNGNLLLFGGVGTLIFSIITLSITINTTLIAFLVGITTFFAIFTIFSLAKIISCLINNHCNCDD